MLILQIRPSGFLKVKAELSEKLVGAPNLQRLPLVPNIRIGSRGRPSSGQRTQFDCVIEESHPESIGSGSAKPLSDVNGNDDMSSDEVLRRSIGSILQHSILWISICSIRSVRCPNVSFRHPKNSSGIFQNNPSNDFPLKSPETERSHSNRSTRNPLDRIHSKFTSSTELFSTPPSRLILSDGSQLENEICSFQRNSRPTFFTPELTPSFASEFHSNPNLRNVSIRPSVQGMHSLYARENRVLQPSCSVRRISNPYRTSLEGRQGPEGRGSPHRLYRLFTRLEPFENDVELPKTYWQVPEDVHWDTEDTEDIKMKCLSDLFGKLPPTCPIIKTVNVFLHSVVLEFLESQLPSYPLVCCQFPMSQIQKSSSQSLEANLNLDSSIVSSFKSSDGQMVRRSDSDKITRSFNLSTTALLSYGWEQHLRWFKY